MLKGKAQLNIDTYKLYSLSITIKTAPQICSDYTKNLQFIPFDLVGPHSFGCNQKEYLKMERFHARKCSMHIKA